MDFDRIEAEMIACAALCVNDFNNEIKDILLVNSANVELLKMLTHFSVKVHCVGLNRANFIANQSANLSAESMTKMAFYDLAINLKVHKFDVIIDLKNNSAENYQKMLKNNGILIVDLESLGAENIAQKNANLNVLMPFRLQSWGSNDLHKRREKYYLFASNKFHPIADLSLQKVDLLDDLQYCNAKIYEGAFALPNYLKAELKGVVRN